MVLTSALDMYARIKSNMALLKKKGYYSKIEIYLPKEKLKNLKFRKASSQEKQRFLSKLQESTKRERKKEWALILITIALCISIFIWLYYKYS